MTELAAPAVSRKIAYRPEIDGLRAVAVLAVVGFHCGITFLSGGFVGVDIFFVISGYLICSILYKEIQSDTFSIARFYERRFKRIIPALSVVLIAVLVMAGLVLSPSEAELLGRSAAATVLSVSNFFFIAHAGYFAQDSSLNPLLMTWSLAVEEQFYIFFPLLILLLRRRSRRTLLWSLGGLTLLSFASSVAMEFRAPTSNFYLPVTRAWELGIGTLLGVWHTGRMREPSPDVVSRSAGIIGLITILATFYFYNGAMRFPGFEALPPVIGAALIIAFSGGLAKRVLSFRLLVSIGLISYSLYLWHWPILSFAHVLSRKPLHAGTIVRLMILAFSAAVASYYFVERPFRAKSNKPTKTILLRYGAAMASLLLVCGVVGINGLPQRYPGIAQIESQANIDRDRGCLQLNIRKLAPYCLVPDNGNKPVLALLGDSHAESISAVLRTRLLAEGWDLDVLTHERCPATKGITRWASVTDYQSCRKFNESALQFVIDRPNIRVVALLAGWGGRIYVSENQDGLPASQSEETNANNLKTGVQNEIAALEANGKRVILLDDFPELPFDPVASVRYRDLPMRRYINKLLASDEPDKWRSESEDESALWPPAKQLASLRLKEIKQSDPRLTFVNLREALCSHNQCYFSQGTDLFYFDPDHLSDSGARRVMLLVPDPNSLVSTSSTVSMTHTP